MITYLQNDKTSSKHSQEVFRFFVLYNSYLQRKEKRPVIISISREKLNTSLLHSFLLTCVAIPPSFLSIWSANIADAALSSILLFVP